MESTNSNADPANAIPPASGTHVINVGKLERMVSVGMGAGLLYGALRSKGFLKYAAILGAGSYLLYRGVSGNCPLSSCLGIGNGYGSHSCCGEKSSLVEIKSDLTVNRSRDAVYDFWRKLENLPRFMTHLKKIKKTGDLHSRWTAKFPGAPTTVSWDAEIVRDEKDALIAWRSLPGSVIENAGEVTFRDAPAGRGTEVAVHISYRPPAGNLGEGVARLLNPVLAELIKEDIRNFKHYLESGEIPG